MTRRTTSLDVLIVGGGVIGWAVAYYTAKAGLRVLVLDPRKTGGNASSVAAGLIAPSPQLTEPTPFARIALKSVELFPSVQQDLFEETGTDIELRMSGTLRIATTEEQAQHQLARLPRQQALGLNLRWLCTEEAIALEPCLTHQVYGAVYGPSESQLSAPKLLMAYRIAAQRHGAAFQQEAVYSLLKRDARIAGVETAKGTIAGRHVVLANGAWAAQANEWLGLDIPIAPERAQLALAYHVVPRPQHIIFGEQIYLTAKANGTVYVGAVKDDAGFNQRPTVADAIKLLTKGTRVVPCLAAGSPGSARVGLRPRTPDGCPIIGPIPGWEGISIAAGHNSNGLLLSAITGQIIASELAGGREPIDATPYQLQRFVLPQLTPTRRVT